MAIKVFILLLALLVTVEGNIQCRDEKNAPVDWFVAYKLPRLRKSTNPLVRNGVAYTYITPDTLDKGWVLSDLSINNTSSFPGRTLQALYTVQSNMESSLLRILYNDQTPNSSVTFLLGHTKGVVMSEAVGGLWLVHSVPHFPPPPIMSSRATSGKSTRNSYSYPATGLRNGQSFLCISLDPQQLDILGVQLSYNEPQIYDSFVPKSLEQTLPQLVAAAHNNRITTAPWYHQTRLASLAGYEFQSFAKSSHFHKDLYADWVAMSLQADLYVESWRNGLGRLPSSCKRPQTVQNVASVNIKAANVKFSSTLDHSKWVVAADNATKPWVCIGDINRMEHQEKRGGGTVCIKNKKLWMAYKQIVNSVDPCPVHQQAYDAPRQ